ncbi:MAG TPA: type III pantothenate kinase, partial [Usitatibacter sp.]
MILAIDAGNTRIKWGLRDGQAWKAAGAIATRDSA